MKSTFKIQPIRLFIPFALVTGVAEAAPVALIDYDDGNPGNGVHQSSIRNGGFEDFNGTNFATTPFWDSYFPEGDSTDPALTTNVRTGILRSLASGSTGSGNRIHLTQTIPATDCVIAAGDVFTFGTWVRGGSLFTIGTHSGQLILEVVDSGGNPVNGPGGHNELLNYSFSPTSSGSYSFYRGVVKVQPGSPWIGHQIRPVIRGVSPRNSFMIVDDVSLVRSDGPIIVTTGTSLDMSLPETWVGGVVPGSGDVANFAQPGIYVAPDGSDFSWAGIESDASGNFLINPDVGGNAYRIHLGSAGISGSQNIDRLGPNLTIDVGTTDQVWAVQLGNFQAAVEGSSTVTYTPPSRLWLRGPSAFTGTWRIDGGIVHPDSNNTWAGSAGATGQLLNNGSLRLSDSSYDRIRLEMVGDGSLAYGGVSCALNRGSGTDTGDIYGPGNLSIATSAVTLNGDVRHSGNTLVNSGSQLTLGSPGIMTFYPGANGVSNSLSKGTGTAAPVVFIDGRFAIDTSGANLTAGNSWPIVQEASLDETYGGSFAVIGYMETTPDIWTREDYGHTYTFTKGTGVLSVVNNSLANVAPTGIQLSPSDIEENSDPGAEVGILTTTDNVIDTFTYTLVTGAGSDDNASFTLSGDRLIALNSFDFETKPSYAVRIRSTDQLGLFFEQTFTVTVLDIQVEDFASWITGSFANGTVPGGQQGPNDDPDGDGISNLIEYALADLDPTVSNSSVGSLTGNSISFNKRQPLVSDISYFIETSIDLGINVPWTEAPAVDSESMISYTLPGGAEKDFMRLKVTQQ